MAYGGGVRDVPWWGVVSSVAAPVLLVSGWTAAASLQPDFNAVRDTVSSLAAPGATDRWVMTATFIVVGVCYLVTGFALRPAGPPGRLILIAGAAGGMLVAVNPIHTGVPYPVPHIIWASVGLAGLTTWPAGAWRRGPATPWALKPAAAAAAVVVLFALLFWFGAELVLGGGQVGLAERVTGVAEALWPLAVVLSCVAWRTPRGVTLASVLGSKTGGGGATDRPDHYKWVVLTNTTLGVLMATIDISIMLIALPDIFRGIHIDPLAPGNSFYLLWMILSFMVVTSVLVVSLGRLGDMYGRVRMYNLGFVVYTFFSLLLTVTWMSGTAAALWLVIMRVFQGVGAAMLMANSSAILTDAFPPDQRGMAIGINQVSAISGSFLGLVLGGVLAPIQWRLIFLVSVPFGLFGTVWAYRSLRKYRAAATRAWTGRGT